MISTPEMPSCLVFRFITIVFLSFHASSMPARASRSLDFALDTELTSSSRSRVLIDLHADSRAAAQVKPERLPHEDWPSGSNRQELLERRMGSKPPDCDGKCDSCQPCEPVELPISNHSVQKAKDSQDPNTLPAQPWDTNYIPESWRCACGSAYYDP